MDLISLFCLAQLGEQAIITFISEMRETSINKNPYRIVKGTTESGVRFFKVLYDDVARFAESFYKIGEKTEGSVMLVKVKPHTIKNADGTDWLNKQGKPVIRDRRAIYIAKGQDPVQAYLRNIHDDLRIVEMSNAVRHSGITQGAENLAGDTNTSTGEPLTPAQELEQLVVKAIESGMSEEDARALSIPELQELVA